MPLDRYTADTLTALAGAATSAIPHAVPSLLRGVHRLATTDGGRLLLAVTSAGLVHRWYKAADVSEADEAAVTLARVLDAADPDALAVPLRVVR
jgi:hypothetical protein